jgi:hypothetical protein
MQNKIVNTVLFFIFKKHIPTVFTQQKRLLSVFLAKYESVECASCFYVAHLAIHIYLLYVHTYIRSILLCAKCELADLSADLLLSNQGVCHKQGSGPDP